jgi:hypothetical protein
LKRKTRASAEPCNQGLDLPAAVVAASPTCVAGIDTALQASMNSPRLLRFYGYIDRPYGAIRSLLRARAADVFQHATNTASERANELVARLRSSVSGLEIGVDVRIDVAKEPEEEAIAGFPPVTHLAIGWKASRHAALFPSMSAHLSVSPMAFAETRLEFDGTYQPPLGVVGDLVNAAIGHQVAEATVHRFVNDVIEEIRREIPAGV